MPDLSGGLFADMFKDATAMVRDHIAAQMFARMQPFNAFLNQALADFQMPERP